MSALLLLASFPAFATKVTEMPDALGVIAGIDYTGSAEQGTLIEAGEQVGKRRISRHDIDLRAAFAPSEGIALTLQIAITPSLAFGYPESRTMIVEPLDGSGSYLFGSPVDETPVIRGSGLEGLWIGAAFAPFSERYKRVQRSTWRLDAALRTPSPKRNLWTAPNGSRGSAPGGTAIRLGAAFSTDRGAATPWLKAEWNKENAVKVDIIDEDGVQWANGLELQPASTVDLTTGVAVVATEDPELGTEFGVDLFVGAQYRTWEDVASGVYLPNVLDGARSIPITVGDTIAARTGVALDYQINENLQARTGIEISYRTPFRLEHVYPVSTSPSTWQIGWTVQFQGLSNFGAE